MDNPYFLSGLAVVITAIGSAIATVIRAWRKGP